MKTGDNKILVIGGGILLLIGIILFFLFFFFKIDIMPPSSTVTKQPQPYRDDIGVTQPYSTQSKAYRLRDASTDYGKLYIEARNARRNITPDYDLSIQKYEEAFKLAGDPDEKGQIRYEIALTKDAQRKEIEAIQILKEVVADASVSNLIRASSLQQMGQIFYNKHQEEVFNEIFKGSPYSDFLVSDSPDESVSTSMRNLFEYGSSIYPLSYFELRIADWYAKELVRRVEGAAVLSELSTEDIKSIILERIKNSDKDVVDMRATYFTDVRIATAFLRKAVIADRLERIGDPFLGDPENIFEKSLQESKISGAYNTEAFALYHFAVFLARNRLPERQGDIKNILSEFYASDIHNRSDFNIFLENEKNDISGGAKVDIELLASIDPKFKLFLIQKANW